MYLIIKHHLVNRLSGPEAGGVHLVFERSGSKEESPRLILKCSRCAMERAKSLVANKIDEFQSNVMSMDVSEEIIPVIIGKGGATIRELKKEGAGATIEIDARTGVIKVYSTDVTTRDTIRQKVEQIIAENQLGYVPIEKNLIGFVLSGKEIRKACADIGCTFNVNNYDTELVIRGTNEHIEQASKLLKDFLASNFISELEIDSDDEPLLFLGGSDSILHKIEAKYDVKAAFRTDKNVFQVRGEADKSSAALEDVRRFLNGGDGMAVCKFKVPEGARGIIIGKGGSNLAKLETDFEGVRIHVPRHNTIISVRGPEDLVKQCRTRLIVTIATVKVDDTIVISPEQHDELSKYDALKRMSRFTNAQLSLNETSIKLRGTSADVRDAKANISEHLTGIYHGYIDLEVSQFSRLKNSITKDSSHFQRIRASTGANVILEDSDCAIHISGKKSIVKKAKSSVMEYVMEFLSFMLPSQLQTVKIHRSLFKSMGDPGRLAQIASETGASISLDRDMHSVLIRSDDSNDCDKAAELVNSMIVECQKLNLVMQLDASDTWLLPRIIGKGGSTIQKLQRETVARFQILKDENTVVISGDSEEVVQAGKEALEELIRQTKRECIRVELPESSMASFIGKGGAGINQLSADCDVQMERYRKDPSIIKITGKEQCVARAQEAVLSWVKEWEVRHMGTTINLEEQIIPSILGKGGETVRSIEKETGCKIDVNKKALTLTVRGLDTDREDAIHKIQVIIDEQAARAAERASAKAKLGHEQSVSATTKTESGSESNNSTDHKQEQRLKDILGMGGTKDRSGEFAKRPVGMEVDNRPVGMEVETTVAIKEEEEGGYKPYDDDYDEDEFNPAIHGTEEGRQLYQWLITGKVGDAIVGIVEPDSDSESSGDEDDSKEANGDKEDKIIVKKSENGEGSTHYYKSDSGFTVRL